MSNNKKKGLCFRCSESDAEKIREASELLNIKPSTFARNAAVAVAEHTIETQKPQLSDKVVGKFADKLEKEAKK